MEERGEHSIRYNAPEKSGNIAEASFKLNTLKDAKVTHVGSTDSGGKPSRNLEHYRLVWSDYR